MSAHSRSAQLASRVLVRRARIGDRPARRAAELVRGRHGGAALPARPRLMPLRDPARPRVALAASAPSHGETQPPAAPAVAGMSDFAARWLFGDGEIEGTPFASGAAIPREHVGQLPSFLSGRREVRTSPEPGAHGRARAAAERDPPLRGQVDEGRPLRVSPVPPAPAPSRNADTTPADVPPPPPRATEEPAGRRSHGAPPPDRSQETAARGPRRPRSRRRLAGSPRPRRPRSRRNRASPPAPHRLPSGSSSDAPQPTQRTTRARSRSCDELRGRSRSTQSSESPPQRDRLRDGEPCSTELPQPSERPHRSQPSQSAVPKETWRRPRGPRPRHRCARQDRLCPTGRGPTLPPTASSAGRAPRHGSRATRDHCCEYGVDPPRRRQ